MQTSPSYRQPQGRANEVFQRIVTWLTRRGVSVYGSRILSVRGRSSGQLRSVPVNPLDHEGGRYLVAPRGQTQWVRNLRVAGAGELRLGRRVERFRAVEVADDDKVEVLRHYLRRWAFEVGTFFDGVTAKATDAEIRAIAPRYPVFVLVASDAE